MGRREKKERFRERWKGERCGKRSKKGALQYGIGKKKMGSKKEDSDKWKGKNIEHMRGWWEGERSAKYIV